jgi:REP element-mobilizing transposase RayT
MARPLRIAYPGALYHVTSRGNAQQRIYEDEGDRHAFAAVLEAVVSRCHWLCHAYCLMDNHYHLVIETPDGNLPRGMRQLNGIYTQRFNRRHGRVGHVFQGRYKTILVDRDSYLLELCRYVVLNPVRAGLVQAPGDYPWSSYRATAGIECAPTFLTTVWVLAQFGRQRHRAQARYQTFVHEGIDRPGPWEQVRGQILLGDETFVTRLQPALRPFQAAQEVPRVQRFADRPRLEDLFANVASHPKTARNQRIRQAHEAYGYTLAAIAQAVGLHYTTVSKIVNARSG